MKIFIWACIALVLSIPASLQAANHVWSGSASGLWSTAANWSVGGPPINGETNVVLSFPASQGNMGSLQNDLTGLTVTSMTFSDTGYAVTGNTISLNGTISLAAGTASGTATLGLPITLTGDSTFASLGDRTLRLNGAISGGFGTVIQSNGGTNALVMFAAANSYSGTTSIQSGTLQVNSILGLGSAAAGTTVSSGATLSLPAGTVAAEAISIAGSGDGGNGAMYCFTPPPGCTWNGPVAMTTDSLIRSAVPMTINGLISGGFNLTVLSSANIAFTANNSYSGTTRIRQGFLRVNGSQPQSPVILGEAVAFSGGTLAGSGSVGPVSIDAGAPTFCRIEPGASTSGPGILSTGAVNLTHPSNLGSLVINLNGLSPGSQYDRLAVTGSVNVTGATLEILRSFSPGLGDTFEIVTNDGSDPVAGVFAGLPEGTIFDQGNRQFQITYLGGTGNDIVLTVTALTPVELMSFEVD